MFNFSFRCIRNREWWSEIAVDVSARNLIRSKASNKFLIGTELARIDLAQAESEN